MNELYILLGHLGSASSLISLALTLAIFFSVGKLKAFYIYTARVPELNEKLGEIVTEISDHLNTFQGNTTKTHEILARAEVNLKSILSKITNGEVKTSIRAVISEIDMCDPKESFFGKWKAERSDEEQKSALERIYVGLYKINIECIEDYDQSRWEK